MLFFEANFPSADENRSPPEATVARTGTPPLSLLQCPPGFETEVTSSGLEGVWGTTLSSGPGGGPPLNPWSPAS